MRLIMIAVATALTFCSTCIAQDRALAPQNKSADATVFGMRMGEKYEVRECAREGKGKFLHYQVMVQTPCFQRMGELTDAPKLSEASVLSDMLWMIYPIGKAPTIVSGFQILVTIIGGNLERVGFTTHGYATQDATLELLKEKYGEPTTLTHIQKQNQMGASYLSINANWHFDNLDVTFDGMTSHVESGNVDIFTPKGLQDRGEKIKKFESAKPRLQIWSVLISETHR